TNGRVIVTIAGESDLAFLDELNQALAGVVADQPSEALIDLARTTFIDSMTLGALVAAAKQLRSRGCSFRVVGASAPEVRRAFEITGLDKYLLEPDVQRAAG